MTVCLGPESVFARKKELLYRPNLSLTNVKQRSLLAFLSILFVLCMLCNSQLYWCCKNGIVILKFLFVRVILTLHWFKHCFRYLWVLIHAGLVLLGLGGGWVCWGAEATSSMVPSAATPSTWSSCPCPLCLNLPMADWYQYSRCTQVLKFSALILFNLSEFLKTWN